MIKKRRDLNRSDEVDLRQSQSAFHEVIAIKTVSNQYDGILVEEYHLSPTYGLGFVHNFIMNDIDITISNYKLEKDTVLYQTFPNDFVQISCLIEGEKIISLQDEKEILYESGESYLASIASFNGYNRIAGGKMFKEVKVRLSTSFLLKHGLAKDVVLKKLTDENLILPITDELLSVLVFMENMDFKGIARKIYLKAKVFELLAIQIENYKKGFFDKPHLNNDRNLKRLYFIKSLINENLHKNFSIDSLSKEVGVNGSLLNKEFVRIFGCTINQYGVSEKMKKAKVMLENTKLPIYQIAEEIGYKNATHFSAAFKRSTGLTPKKYRARI